MHTSQIGPKLLHLLHRLQKVFLLSRMSHQGLFITVSFNTNFGRRITLESLFIRCTIGDIENKLVDKGLPAGIWMFAHIHKIHKLRILCLTATLLDYDIAHEDTIQMIPKLRTPILPLKACYIQSLTLNKLHELMPDYFDINLTKIILEYEPFIDYNILQEQDGYCDARNPKDPKVQCPFCGKTNKGVQLIDVEKLNQKAQEMGMDNDHVFGSIFKLQFDSDSTEMKVSKDSIELSIDDDKQTAQSVNFEMLDIEHNEMCTEQDVTIFLDKVQLLKVRDCVIMKSETTININVAWKDCKYGSKVCLKYCVHFA